MIATCTTAHVMHAPRHPIAWSSHADSGQPIVLAKPAISVMPVIGVRASCPYIVASAANAVSYKPSAMPRPSTIHANPSDHGPCAAASSTSPSGSTIAEDTSTLRPPNSSMCRPIAGPRKLISTSDTENAPNTNVVVTPSDAAIESARTAGR